MKYTDPSRELVFYKFTDFKTKTRITLTDGRIFDGFIQSFSPGTGKLSEKEIWCFLEFKNVSLFEKTKSDDLLQRIQHNTIKLIQSID